MKIKTRIVKILRILGPGFISGASDDDPTAIAAYTQAGAQFGYGQLWTTLFTFPFMAVVQEMCGRIGLVTGKGLAAIIRKNYSKPLLYLIVFILLIANTINIGADLGAMAASAQLIWGLPFVFWLIAITAFTLVMEVFVSYKVYARFLKYLALTMLIYVFSAFTLKLDWFDVLKSTFIPSFSFDKAFLVSLAAILGTNLSPYLFFWQADEEVEEEVQQHKIRSMGRGVPKVTKRDFRNLKYDTIVGMFLSNVIVFFVCVVAAGTLNKNGIFSIGTPAEAALALKPIAGNFASILFAIGIIASGLLAVPVLAGSASYALSEAFSWKEGFYRKFQQAHGFYGVITIATLVGLLMNFSPIEPFKMLVYSAVLNAVLAPILIFIIMLIANNKKIMGDHRNSLKSNIFNGIIALAMTVVSIVTIINLIIK